MWGMIPPSEGRYFHCSLCDGPLFVRYPDPNAVDYLGYCANCKGVPAMTGDDPLDAHETLKAITLMATLLRLLGVKEVYHRDP